MSRFAYLFVACGGAAGSMARYWLTGVIGRRFDQSFPYGTLMVNVSGCLIIGILAAFTLPEARVALRPEWKLALMTGLCGGYTTFSAFSLETFTLGSGGNWLRAGANIVASVVLCLAAVWLGYFCANPLAR